MNSTTAGAAPVAATLESTDTSYELECAIRSTIENINASTGATRARLRYHLQALLDAQLQLIKVRPQAGNCCGGCHP